MTAKLTKPQRAALLDIQADNRRNLFAGKRAMEMLTRLEEKYLIKVSLLTACGWELTPMGQHVITPPPIEPSPNDLALAAIDAVNDPIEALRIVWKEWDYIGSDPYYRDFSNALHRMVERCVPDEAKS